MPQQGCLRKGGCLYSYTSVSCQKRTHQTCPISCPPILNPPLLRPPPPSSDSPWARGWVRELCMMAGCLPGPSSRSASLRPLPSLPGCRQPLPARRHRHISAPATIPLPLPSRLCPAPLGAPRGRAAARGHHVIFISQQPKGFYLKQQRLPKVLIKFRLANIDEFGSECV